jgi:protein-S-isoprenylcysteine O-methyltransferase Ste14
MLLNVMKAEEFYPTLFTAFQFGWASVWAAKHIRIRSRRRYANNKPQFDTNSRYKVASHFLFIVQSILCIASFWSDSQLLLKTHDGDAFRFIGVLLISLATVLYFRALSSLGRNYSPCFDSHLPFELISSGPYRFTRHPMYLAKLVIVTGNFIISGSLWFVAVFIYLMLETIRTIAKEERHLEAAVKEYAGYKRRTTRMIPFVI